VYDRRTTVVSDWFSVGVVAFRCLAGQYPFTGRNRREVRDLVVAGSVVWHSLPPDTTPAMRDLLQRLLATAPSQRLGWNGDAAEVLAHPVLASDPQAQSLAALRGMRIPASAHRVFGIEESGGTELSGLTSRTDAPGGTVSGREGDARGAMPSSAAAAPAPTMLAPTLRGSIVHVSLLDAGGAGGGRGGHSTAVGGSVDGGPRASDGSGGSDGNALRESFLDDDDDESDDDGLTAGVGDGHAPTGGARAAPRSVAPADLRLPAGANRLGVVAEDAEGEGEGGDTPIPT
jgi:hypothetical protein